MNTCFRWATTCLTLAAICLAPLASARPQVGLVLGGGGARGLAHVGVIKMLEHYRVPIDCITGTSAGALIGGMYASGMSIEEIEKRMKEADWDDLFDSRLKRQDEDFRRKREDRTYMLKFELGVKDGEVRLPRGAVNTEKIELFIRELTQSVGPESFDKLAVPYRAIATDLETGNLYEFSKGDLALAMRASMSVPGAFEPVQIGDKLLVDGGLARNLPVENARALCKPDTVIVVNVGSPPLKRDDLSSIIGVMQQMVDLGINKNVREQLATLKSNDILIQPLLGDITAADFPRVAEIIPKGEQAAELVKDRLLALSLPEKEFTQHIASRLAYREPIGIVDEIRIAATERVNIESIAAKVNQMPGEPIDQKRFHKELLNLFGSGDFDSVDYQITREKSRRVLNIQPVEKAEGLDILRFGLGLSATSHDVSSFTMVTAYRRRWANALGAEWKTEASIGKRLGISTEWYQPLRVGSRWFISPEFKAERRLTKVYQNGDAGAEFSERDTIARVDLGMNLDDYGEIRIGPYFGRTKAIVSIGIPDLPSFSQRLGGVHVDLTLDKVDNPSFPNHGWQAHGEYRRSVPAMGADERYERLESRWEGATSWKQHVLQAVVKGGTSLGSTLPGTEAFTMGGFGHLSGYAPDEFRGERMSYGRLTYLYRIPVKFAKSLYIGASAEAGRMDDRAFNLGTHGTKTSLGLHVGLDTLLGPLYLGVGRGETGRNAVYLFLGAY
ncbi:NTE family protein [Chitinivorax tropicus]|uniref:NTE family protein n=1 Tax=Chitinivorax tropicus TaxID=714531 RepID=A0A840MM29_9PROT|nr:patatin-like phospholipase family protein [Chitinivorax tropicus]MBB5017586.1 NTE family protein [Chitinivorax tropicus]